MPSLPKHQCRKSGCPALLDHSEGGFCAAHRKAKYQAQDAHRGTPAERGYDSDWVKVRNLKRQRNPLCEQCWKDGQITPMAEVHHTVPIATDRSKRLDMDNLMSLCKVCHSRITMQESVR